MTSFISFTSTTGNRSFNLYREKFEFSDDYDYFIELEINKKKISFSCALSGYYTSDAPYEKWENTDYVLMLPFGESLFQDQEFYHCSLQKRKKYFDPATLKKRRHTCWDLQFELKSKKRQREKEILSQKEQDSEEAKKKIKLE